jgi:hypothetical protein
MACPTETVDEFKVKLLRLPEVTQKVGPCRLEQLSLSIDTLELQPNLRLGDYKVQTTTVIQLRFKHLPVSAPLPQPQPLVVPSHPPLVLRVEDDDDFEPGGSEPEPGQPQPPQVAAAAANGMDWRQSQLIGSGTLLTTAQTELVQY